MFDRVWFVFVGLGRRLSGRGVGCGWCWLVVRSTCPWRGCFVLVVVPVKGVGDRPAIFWLSSLGQVEVS